MALARINSSRMRLEALRTSESRQLSKISLTCFDFPGVALLLPRLLAATFEDTAEFCLESERFEGGFLDSVLFF